MTDNEPKPEVDDFLNQPHTKVVLDRIGKEHKLLVLAGLLRAAKSSTDPKVVLWYARYEALENLESFLATGEFKP
jgi:hypothetical protein